ncbi:Transcription factor [Mactra antiquata]
MLNDESRVSFHTIPDTEGLIPNTVDINIQSARETTCCRSTMESPTFLDISNNMQHPALHDVIREPESDSLISWTQKHPEHWSQNEILDWIYFVASTLNVDPTTIRGEGFQNITGPELCRMTVEDFLKRDPVNGKCFYDMFRSLHRDAFFSGPPTDDYYNLVEVKQEPGTNMSPCPYSSALNKLEDENILTSVKGSDMEVLIDSNWYDIDLPEDIERVTQYILANEADYGYGSSDSDSQSDHYETMNICNRTFRNDSVGSDTMSDDEISHLSSSSNEERQQKRLPRRTGTKKTPKLNNNKPKKNRGRKPGQLTKGNHLWEFILELLRDPKCNPQYLKWEEKDTGVFRIVRSEIVADLWGKKKHNPDMTYEKLSRAMRFCRTAGHFAEVPKTGKFPKKLCFRFGAKAVGWKD